MKTKLIARVKPDQFDKVFTSEVKKGQKEWEIAFSDVINCANRFSFTQSFWYIGDFLHLKL